MEKFSSGDRMRRYDFCSFVGSHELLCLNIVQIKLDARKIKCNRAMYISGVYSKENAG